MYHLTAADGVLSWLGFHSDLRTTEEKSQRTSE